MNPQSSNPDPNAPNFDFIMQQGGHGNEPTPKRSVSGKIIVLVILICLLVVTLIIGAIVSTRDNVQPEEQQQSSALNAGQVQDEQNLITSFYSYMISGDYEAAYKLFDGNPEVSKADLDQDVKAFWDTVDIAKCQFTEASEQSASDQSVQRVNLLYACPFTDDSSSAMVLFGVTAGEQKRIIGYNYVVEVMESEET